MKSVTKSRTTDVWWIRIVPLAVLAAFLISTNAGHLAAQQGNQKSYASPKEAIQALVSAVNAEDRDQLILIFGPEAKEILYSGDEVADKQTREKFLQKYNQMSRLETEPDGSVDLYIGAENWPFPIPIVKKHDRWLFDTATGKKEILYRRIGRNEFDTIDTLQGLVDALRLENIDANSKNHSRAATIRAFISRTATARPSNTAREMMEWPMLSSTISRMAATGCTL